MRPKYHDPCSIKWPACSCSLNATDMSMTYRIRCIKMPEALWHLLLDIRDGCTVLSDGFHQTKYFATGAGISYLSIQPRAPKG